MVFGTILWSLLTGFVRDFSSVISDYGSSTVRFWAVVKASVLLRVHFMSDKKSKTLMFYPHCLDSTAITLRCHEIIMPCQIAYYILHTRFYAGLYIFDQYNEGY